MQKTEYKNILFIVMSVLLSIGVLELIGFAVNHAVLKESENSNICPADRYEWDTYSIMRQKKNITGYDGCYINSYGLRGKEFSKEKSTDTFRIFITGGSTVWGSSIYDNETISYLLNKKLNNLNKSVNFEVINAGIEGYESTQEFISTARTIQRYNPDMIIVFDGRNDIYYSTKSYWSYNTNHDAILKLTYLINSGPLDNLKNIILRFYGFIKENSNFVKMIRGLKKTGSIYEKTGTARFEAMEEYANNLDMIVNLDKSRGISTILIFQPTLGYGNKKLSDSEKEKYDIISKESNWPDILKVMMPLGEEKLLYVARFNNVTGASFVKIFDNVSENIYIDSAHYNKLGNDIIAEKMKELILAGNYTEDRTGVRAIKLNLTA